MLNFSVKKIEGLEENLSFSGLYISVDNNLLDVITPLTQTGLECSVKIPSTGTLRLIIKNMREGDRLIGSVSISLAQVPGFPSWLPLFDSLDYDSISSIPVKVESPKIQIQVSQVTETHSFVERIKSLQLKISDLEHTLASERWEFQKEIGSLSSSQRYREDSQTLIIEQQKIQIEKQEALINDLMAQNTDFFLLKEKITTSQECLKSSEACRSDLQNKIEELIDKISIVGQCKNCEKNEDILNEITRQLIGMKKEETRVHSISFDSFNDSDLQNKTNEHEAKKSFSSKKEEEQIESELKNSGISFKRIGTGQYLCNGQFKVNVFIENDSVFCRMGKVFSLNEFSVYSQSASQKTCENCLNFSKQNNEVPELCDSEEGKEEKRKEKNKMNFVKAQFRPEKKAFIPLRQTSAHLEKKRCK